MLLFLSLLMVAALQDARNPDEQELPAYKLLRAEEDWSYLRDPDRRKDLFDPLKFIPLDSDSWTYLTLGADIRERLEYFHSPDWGAGPGKTLSLLQRYMVHADLHAGPSFRVFAQLKSGLEYGRTGGPRPPDEDRLDFHQGFLDGVWKLSEEGFLTLRLGRQEMQYGGRLVSVREGPNVRQSFDAARFLVRMGEWEVDAFGSRPVETQLGVFDDGPDEERWFWGIYVLSPPGWLWGMTVDLYYLGLDHEAAVFDQGVAHEVRHSVGTRLFGQAGALDYNCELVYQFGRFGRGAIRAWTAASDTGVTFKDVPGKPRVGLHADAASGDPDPFSPDLGTFNALFPKGSYFSETGLIGPANFYDLHPALALELTPDVNLTADWDFFWRQSTRDGIYGAGINVVRTGQVTRARSVGSQFSVSLAWQIDRHLELVLYYAHFFAGPFIEETPPGDYVDFVATWLTFRF